MITCILDLLRKPDDVLLGSHLAASARCAARHFAQAAFALACLPYEAFFSLDAIVRTAIRMFVTRRRLLEWSPSADPDRDNRASLFASCRSMWIAPLLAAAAGIYLALSRPAALAAAVPILGLWFASPAIAWWISRPLARREARLTVEQTIFLRRLSRKIWAFFETFVGPEDHWLPPDNFQEHPVEVVGHRTSPTNMGLALLANLSAYDFGYIPAGKLIERTGNAFDTMESLERHRGHFYNWYDTKSLKPLLAGLRFVRGQRKPRRPPVDITGRAARASRSQDPGAAIFRRARRHAEDTGGGCGRSRSSRAGRTAERSGAVLEADDAGCGTAVSRQAGKIRRERWRASLDIDSGSQASGGRAPLPGNARKHSMT